jgi:peptide/nickel transport system ATP-binding protein
MSKVKEGTLLLEAQRLKIGFARKHGTPLVAVNGVDLSLRAGETFALVGESGSGKSLSALALMRLLPASGRYLDGEIQLGEENILQKSEAAMRHVRGGRMAMIFQEPGTSLNPVMTVGKQIGEVLSRHRGLEGSAARQEALSLLTAVGIADVERRLDEYSFQLSGGMKQRVMIAMALAGEPEILLADEPTTALDVTVQAQILALLKKLQGERGMAILLITHDLGIVAQMAERVGVMYAGELVEVATREQFLAGPRHPYTRALIAALPEGRRRQGTLQAIGGQVPALAAMPPGCRFADRCPLADARCEVESPGWTQLGEGHEARCHRLAEALPVIAEAAPAAPAGPADEAPVLRLDDLKVHFPIRRGLFKRVVGHVRAVDGVSLALRAGRTLALVGESGCGKTTVGKASLRLIPNTGGSIELAGRRVERLVGRALQPSRRAIQMVFQDPYASLNPKRSVGEILREGLDALEIGATAERADKVAGLLKEVGLDPAMAQRYPHEFSGGQRQRIAIARALAVSPKIIVCDEPTSALDVSVQAQILNLMRRVQLEHGIAYLFITHNLGVVDYLADDVAVMYLGRIVEEGTVDEIMHAPRHPYTQALLAAVPKFSGGSQGDYLQNRLPGEIPSPANPPAGCHFHPRCPYAEEICREQYPEPRKLSATHLVRCHFAEKTAGGPMPGARRAEADVTAAS